jgi:hypothetical protein
VVLAGAVAGWVGVAAGVAGAAGAPAPAPAGTVIASGVASPAITDGRGTIAFSPSDGTIRVVDAQAGTSFDTAPGNHCPHAVVQAVGGGQVMLSCGPSPDAGSWTRMLLLDVAQRAFHVPAGVDALSIGDGITTLGEVGADGIGYSYWGGHSSPFWGALNWRSGQVVAEPSDRATTTDLDDPTLQQTLCAPLRRMNEPAQISRDQGSFQFEAPYGLEQSADGTVTIQRCGSARTTTLLRSHLPATGPELASGFVTWTVPGPLDASLYAYLPTCAARLRWPVSAVSDAAHVAGGVVVSEKADASGPWQVRRISIGDACARIAPAARLTLGAGGRTTTTVARSGTLVDAPTGASAVLPRPTTSLSRLGVRSGRRIVVRTASPARSVRWHLNGVPWAPAHGDGTMWWVRAPPTHAARTLAVSVVLADGGDEQFELRMPRTDG